MKLNINLVSHPIIENLSTVIVHHKASSGIKNHKSKYFGLLLAYEAVRNWTQAYRLHIQQIKSELKITTIDPKESYLMIINNLQHFSYFHEIENLLPKIDLAFIREDDVDKADGIINKVTTISKYTKVIIALDKLQSTYVVKILEHLIKERQININQIRLISMLCTKDEIIRLSQKQDQLDIYTSKIL